MSVSAREPARVPRRRIRVLNTAEREAKRGGTVRGVGIAPTLALVTGLPGTGKSRAAAVVADALGTAVLAHDWAMSGLRTYPDIQAALDDIDWGHRVVGWSILLALARAQLVEHRSVVLDGVARSAQREQCVALARDVGASLIVITTECSDRAVHRSRIVGRQRLIPDWYEVRWDNVERAATQWERLESDLNLDAVKPWSENEDALRRFLADRHDRLELS
jgi:predicted kinase